MSRGATYTRTVRGDHGVEFEVRLPHSHTVVTREREARGAAATRLLQNLDRSEQGRHRGDVESGASSGFSEGNPFLAPGQRIGTDVHGNPITFPEHSGERSDLSQEDWYTGPGVESSREQLEQALVRYIEEFGVNDLSDCEYFTGQGSCSYGCGSRPNPEPECHTMRPATGWPMEGVSVELRRRLEVEAGIG